MLPYYMTQLIGNPRDMLVLMATAGFTRLGLIDGDPYWLSVPDYGATNVFYLQVMNLISTTNVAAGTAVRDIH
jgi:glucan 1,3-beta-glucosidase